jgi:hypothetical protein
MKRERQARAGASHHQIIKAVTIDGVAGAAPNSHIWDSLEPHFSNISDFQAVDDRKIN